MSSDQRVSIKGEVIAEIVAGNPGGKLKSVEYGSFGNIVKIEWYEPDDPEALAGDAE
jgi:hypothetical protein